MLDNEYLQGIAGKTRSDRELTVMEQMAQEILAARKVVEAARNNQEGGFPIGQDLIDALAEYDQVIGGGDE